MHLFLNFSESQISGEGTDYVGPWAISGEFDQNSNECRWTKKYIGKHQVRYVGKFGREGIIGHWDISSILTGNFHIWPANFTEIQEMYLREEDGNNVPGTIPLNPLKLPPDNLA